MMSIGEFAELTGHTVRALRHYDEAGVLSPATVDPQSRYRRYTADQLRPATILKVLRGAEVSLPEASVVLTSPADAADVLDRQRDRVLAARRAQDEADRRARATLSALDRPIELTRRAAEPQAWVGIEWDLPLGDVEDDRANAEADAAFGRLYAALVDADRRPVGGFWSVIRPGATPEQVRVVLCWPVRSLPAGPLGLPDRVVSGSLPSREEVVARVSTDLAPEEGLLHPGVIALLEAIEQDGIDTDSGRLRQVGVLDANGEVTAMELIYDLAG